MSIAWFAVSIKISYTFEKTLVLSIICSKCECEDEITLKMWWKKHKLRI